MAKTTADLLVERLIDWGVDTVFGLPGDGVNGLYDAKCDLQPVLAITGHTFHDLIGTHHQQDVDLDKLFMDVAAFNQRVMGPAHVNNLVDEAIKTALSRRTVAH